MSVFELQQRNKRVFVQNLELVGQFLERHVSASFRCAIHAHRSRCSNEQAILSSTASIEFRSLTHIPGSLAEGGSEAGKLSSNPSSRSFSRRAFFCNSFASRSAFLSGRLGPFGVLRDMACLLSVVRGTVHRCVSDAILTERLDKQRTWVHDQHYSVARHQRLAIKRSVAGRNRSQKGIV